MPVCTLNEGNCNKAQVCFIMLGQDNVANRGHRIANTIVSTEAVNEEGAHSTRPKQKKKFIQKQ